MESKITRREFIGTTAAAGAGLTMACSSSSVSSYKRIIGANDRISIGIIGCGSRGTEAHMPGIQKHVEEMNFEVTAVCDPYRVAREKANSLAKEWYGRDTRQFVSHLDLLALKDVDAVMIASCDHQHATHLLNAAKAGKDMYTEKPLGMDFKTVKKAVKAVKDAGSICQVGTQLRSMASFTGCKELYKSGKLGKVSRVEQNRNTGRPYWYSYIKDVKKQDLDWKEFLFNRPFRPFDPVQHSAWYGYRDFSDGPVPQWGVHYLDLVHYITGTSFPESCVCLGTTSTWKDEHHFDVPDNIEATWIYPEGFMVHYSTNCGNSFGNTFKIYGDQGVLKMDHWSEPVLTAEGGTQNKGVIRGEQPVEGIERPDHFLNWLQCLRSKETPHASIDTGLQHMVAVEMARMSLDEGKKTVFDKDKLKVKTA